MLLIQKKRFRLISVFLLMEMVFNIFYPTVSFALTAGPTAPEATSFEPVDTTDVVDLKTGDFTYNIPVLEVPGPGGGYPLALSYHAGIQPDQEASWTGLGFTLNPGSISRLVNGYPDDHNAITNVDRSFWKGGETESSSIGISYGIANVCSVSAGLTFSQDTYRGRGVGGQVGVSAGIGGEHSPLQGNASIGISPYGDPYASAGLSVGVGAVSVGLSVSSNSGTAFNGNVGFGGIQASISSDGSKPSLSVAGSTAGIYNSKENHVSINSSQFSLDIPVYYGINLRLGRSYQRYWIDETSTAFTFGSMYLDDVDPSQINAFDTYDLLDISQDISIYDDAEKVLGGSFPDVDQYTVTAQGLSGNMQPFHYRQYLYRQDKQDQAGKYLTKGYPLTTTPIKKGVEFRFINDFSNRFEYDPGDFDVANNKVSFDFDGVPVTGENGTDGYDDNKNQLAGSKHVEWYTNAEILRANPNVNPFEDGFIDAVAEGYQRDNNSQIGGYSITNASGVTYHYALPAYSYDEYMKSVNSSTRQAEDGERWNELKKPTKYAYTWYLTAMTGPDYVDRNNNGFADHDDWGYWVNFEYKKWLSDYKWRNPGEGTNRDLDGDFENFAAGNKELYYLEKIITQSHVAIFEKSERLDGREVMDLKLGGFEPTPVTDPTCIAECNTNCDASFCSNGECQEPGRTNCLQVCTTNCPVISHVFPKASLRLDKIKLFNYDDFISQNVSDAAILRSIEFTYDYSLAPGTPNSYDEDLFNVKLGKLTLKSLSFLGKQGVSIIPPMEFGYKNIAYEKGKVDVWGFYKNDFSETYQDQTNNIIAKLTTDQSALDVDAWSLNEIKTSLGATIKINYESDQYEDVVFNKQQSLRIKEVTDFGTDKLKVTFWESGVNLSNFFTPGQSVDIDLIGSYYNRYHSSFDCSGDCDDIVVQYAYNPILFSAGVIVDQINSVEGSVIVTNHEFYNKLKYDTKSYSNLILLDQSNKKIQYTFTYGEDQAWPDYFPAGIISRDERSRKGGGLRVKSVELHNSSSEKRITSYEYEEGTTSYEPYEILAPKILPEYAALVNPIQTKVFYKKALLNKLYSQIGISRQLPGPGVIYRSVNVREFNVTEDGVTHELPNYSRYQFSVYQEGMIDVAPLGGVNRNSVTGTYNNVNFNGALLNKVSLKDFSTRVGNLESITLLRSSDDTPVSKTTNHYLHSDLSGSFEDNSTQYANSLKANFSNQGLIEETFTRARIVQFRMADRKPYAEAGGLNYYDQDERNLLATISKHESYPSVFTGQTNINYQTGVESSSKNLAFDFYSGQTSKVLSSDSYGKAFLSVTIPAYKHYPAMGLKIGNGKMNKNMLEQTAEQYSFVVDGQQQPTGVLSAMVQTWNNQVPVLNLPSSQFSVWRAQASYQWNGEEYLNADGSYPYSDFSLYPFNWVNSEANTKWEKGSDITLYDIYSHALEAKDINSNYTSTRMNKDQTRVIASASNAKYKEMVFSGAEYYAGNTDKEGDVARGDGSPSPAYSHTGKYSLLVGLSKSGFNYTIPASEVNANKKYRASVWVYAPGDAETQSDLDKIELFYNINGTPVASIHPVIQKSKAKSWYLLNIDIAPNGANSISIGVRNGTQRGIYFDDFRVHPLNASMTSFVYDPLSGEVTHILDANNFYTKFEYDAMGRLVRSSKELLNFDYGAGKESYRADLILKEVRYNYAKSN